MRIDHVGIAVRDLAEARGFYRDRLGLAVLHEEEVASQRVRVAFLGEPGAEASVELLEPTDPDGAVGRFLLGRGPGLHHLAFHAPDLAGEMARLAKAGAPPIEAAPRPGARGHRVCFVHPKHALGTLIELVG